MLSLCVDPGKSGGFSWTRPNRILGACSMPKTMRDVWDLYQDINPDRVVIEKVGGFIKGVKSPGSAMFNFGDNFGMLKAYAIAMDVPLVLVRPQQWQQAVSAGTKGDRSTTVWKNHLKGLAQQRAPHLGKITLAMSDAILMAEAARLGKI